MVTKEQIQRLNPEMAATWIVGSGAPLSEPQYKALVIASRNGGYVEAGTGSYKGHVERVAASSLRALIRRGYLIHCYGTEGHVAGRLSEFSLGRLSELVML